MVTRKIIDSIILSSIIITQNTEKKFFIQL